MQTKFIIFIWRVFQCLTFSGIVYQFFYQGNRFVERFISLYELSLAFAILGQMILLVHLTINYVEFKSHLAIGTWPKRSFFDFANALLMLVMVFTIWVVFNDKSLAIMLMVHMIMDIVIRESFLSQAKRRSGQ